MAAQDELAELSRNVDHRVLPEATHTMLVENETIAAHSSRAIRDVVNAVRSGAPWWPGDPACVIRRPAICTATDSTEREDRHEIGEYEST